MTPQAVKKAGSTGGTWAHWSAGDANHFLMGVAPVVVAVFVIALCAKVSDLVCSVLGVREMGIGHRNNML